MLPVPCVVVVEPALEPAPAGVEHVAAVVQRLTTRVLFRSADHVVLVEEVVGR